MTDSFTMPGETGCEEYVLELAEKWGADMIRDCNGTKLSPKMLQAAEERGLAIYFTICLIRGHNDFLREHPDMTQQCFLSTEPMIMTGGPLVFNLLEDYFSRQFKVNESRESLAYWQVYDRTADRPIPRDCWAYADGAVTIDHERVSGEYDGMWHSFTVSFLAFRVWEEIEMYNYLTNGWDGEPLMPIDPIYPEAREYLKSWLRDWCRVNPEAKIVRFTSLFYNFAWIWGRDGETKFADWASYDFAVSPLSLRLFEEAFGYALTAEDFIGKGRHRATHRVPGKKKRDFMEYVSRFVRSFGKELVDIVHEAGKEAYIFCDDSWLGLEPYNGKFEDFGFDGFIKCLFSGYEARFCAGVPCSTRKIRLHPYLFPVGLGGQPTFSAGGRPEADTLSYWMNIRRALLREPVERVGLGGYPSLTKGFPSFIDTVTDVLREFRRIKSLHEHGAPEVLPVTAAVLTSWGKLRSWTLSGHFHETNTHVLIHILEALSGFPIDVRFIGFDELTSGALSGVNVLINAGRAGDAWSGGELWTDEAVRAVTEYVYKGGVFLGVNEPSAAPGHDTFFRMAGVLGVDFDDGRYACFPEAGFEVSASSPFLSADLPGKPGIRLVGGGAEVLSVSPGGTPALTKNAFGKGVGAYMSGFVTNPVNNRFLIDLILSLTGVAPGGLLTDNPYVDCAVYKEEGVIAFANSSFEPQYASVALGGRPYRASLEPAGMATVDIKS